MKRSKGGRRRETEGDEVDGQFGGKSAAGRGRKERARDVEVEKTKSSCVPALPRGDY